MKKVVMEFLGTFFFILTIAMTANPFAIAAMLMAWVYIGGYISGAHYNPMVSLAIALRGRLSWHMFGKYVIAQILGGFTAYVVAGLMGNVIIPAPGVHVTFLHAFIIEVLLAFVLALIVLVVATSSKFKTLIYLISNLGRKISYLNFIPSPLIKSFRVTHPLHLHFIVLIKVLLSKMQLTSL